MFALGWNVCKACNCSVGGKALSLWSGTNETWLVGECLWLTLQDLVSLFANEDCPSCVTCEFADNNCWYVTFDSEESTQEV